MNDPRMDSSYIPPTQDLGRDARDSIRDAESGAPISGIDSAFGWNLNEDGTASRAALPDAVARGYAPPLPGSSLQGVGARPALATDTSSTDLLLLL